MKYLNLLLLGAAMALSACGGSKFRSYDGPAVTAIVVHKADRQMFLLHDNEVLKNYQVALGGNPVGDKQVEGDGKTPEGTYFINRRNARSAYHLSLGISYPNDQDRAEAKGLGKPPGGDIFVHGQSRRKKAKGTDWTAGCIAVTNPEIEEVYSMVKVGTPIFIKP